MNFYQIFQTYIETATERLAKDGKLQKGLDLSKVVVEPTKDPAHGDLATNVAMVLCKQANLNPKDLAVLFIKELLMHKDIATAVLAGPGFINISLHQKFWYEQLAILLKEGDQYGSSNMGEGEKVLIEYCSVNPTGPLHIGHARNAIFGDVLANLLTKVGYQVHREYYVNDGGGQIKVLGRSVYQRYLEASGEKIGEIAEGLYPGDYLKPVGEALYQQDGDQWKGQPEEKWLDYFGSFAAQKMLEIIKEDLKAVGITFDEYFSEKSLIQNKGVEKAFQHLQDKGLIYEGVLAPPKGKQLEDWEPTVQTLFKSTQFGDDVDRSLKKSDGSWAYIAPDIAYHYNKYQRGFKHMIDVFGADHGGYVTRLNAAVAALTDQQADLDVKLTQMVALLDHGVPVKMSKRSGAFITMRDVLEEVGRDAIRFMMLTKKNDQHLDFDFAKVTEQSKDNPIFYVQYAHARAHSVMRHFGEMGQTTDGADLFLLNDPDELLLIKQMVSWPRTLEVAALHHEPHRLAYYLYDLAGAFHSLWNKGRDDTTLRFILENDIMTSKARVLLVKALANVISSGLGVFGIKPMVQM